MAHQLALFLFILVCLPYVSVHYFSEEIILILATFTLFNNHLFQISCLFSSSKVFNFLLVFASVNFSCLVIEYHRSLQECH